MAGDRSSEGGPALSVVVCTRDRAQTLAGTLAALKKVLRPIDEAIVVDSASRDPAVVRDVVDAAGFRYVRLDEPGASRARNAGFAVAAAPLVAFMDDDCAPAEGWGDAVAGAFADDALGFVTGAVLADKAHGLPLSLFTDADARRIGRDDDPFSLGSGGNMTVRRRALEAIGGWDESLGPATTLRAAEDVDVLWRVLHAGWSGAYEPRAAVVHHQWQSRREAVGRMYGYGIGAGGFIGKVMRIDRAEGRRILRRRLGADGFAQAWRVARSGWITGAVAELIGLVGVLVGLMRARRHGVVGTRFTSRRARS